MTPWIHTMRGRKVNPLDPMPEDIDIEEIAHALGYINRFCGHPRIPINVAQHSVYVSRLSGVDYQLQGLLHDASEAYLGDITKWLKRSDEFAAYREAEDRVQRTIYRVFGCDEEMHLSVEMADKLMVRVEGEYSWGPDWNDVPGYGKVTPAEWALVEAVTGRPYEPWSGSMGRFMFLKRYEELTR